LRHCNDAEHKSREEERPVENKCPQRVNHEKYANAKADPPSDDGALLYVRLQFLHDCAPVFVDERLGALILTLRLVFAVLKLALSLGVVGRYLDLYAHTRDPFLSRSLLRSIDFLLQNCAIPRRTLQSGFVRFTYEKHAAQRGEKLRKCFSLNYKSAALPTELCRAVASLTGKIQSAGVERQLWVGHLRRKARKLLLVPPTTSICRPEIKVLPSNFYAP
jgi:hypothetical protein